MKISIIIIYNYLLFTKIYILLFIQVVNGYKEFSILKTLNAYTEENVLIPSVNRIRIQKLNESIIFKEDINNIVVKGTKTFIEGFETTNLHVNNIYIIYIHINLKIII